MHKVMLNCLFVKERHILGLKGGQNRNQPDTLIWNCQSYGSGSQMMYALCEDADDTYKMADLVMRSRFSQCPEFKKYLLSTGELRIGYDVNDRQLGIGADGLGNNIVGKILMEIRRENPPYSEFINKIICK